ncbi:MAG TPA: DUF4296 domain-containing protein [Pontibacter sp.]
MKRLFPILFCLALLGCKQQNDANAPEGLLPRAKMVQILADVHTMEALIEANVNYPDTAMMAYNKQQKAILQKYGVTAGQFYSTYTYYSTHLPEMDKLYEVVLDTLTAREAKMAATKGTTAPAEEETTMSKKDSLRRRGIELRRNSRIGTPMDLPMRAPEEKL